MVQRGPRLDAPFCGDEQTRLSRCLTRGGGVRSSSTSTSCPREPYVRESPKRAVSNGHGGNSPNREALSEGIEGNCGHRRLLMDNLWSRTTEEGWSVPPPRARSGSSAAVLPDGGEDERRHGDGRRRARTHGGRTAGTRTPSALGATLNSRGGARVTDSPSTPAASNGSGLSTVSPASSTGPTPGLSPVGPPLPGPRAWPGPSPCWSAAPRSGGGRRRGAHERRAGPCWAPRSGC